MGVIMEAQNIGFGYDGSQDRVFDRLSFAIHPGDVFCILGPNGTGKSTLLKCLAGIEPVSSGHVVLQNRNIATLSRAETARIIAYVPQSHQSLFAFTVFDVVVMGRAPHIGVLSSPSQKDYEIADKAITAMGITHLRDKQYTNISGGERQLVLFARILAQEPKVLLLDEPTSHLDFGNQVQVLALVKQLAERGIAVIMTTHFPDHAFLVGHETAIMASGRFMVQGPPHEVVTASRLSDVYAAEVRLVDIEGYGRICVPLLPDGVASLSHSLGEIR
ncbi:ABC transporter ATP-binding protein [Desulfovibrio inopinatus]|uniref:ABC transporter ATP-binding protein n=1 Tax=Desulfovibrio inopinatus TaxID=102109 RepID=UPI0004272472|nr:ABC transporter ATP-binding protein [Desulfovibrio inopinatus]